MPLTLDDFDYPLPPGLIAQAPLPERSASRLLIVADGKQRDSRFSDLPEWLAPGDLLVMNDSRVLHARLFGRKESGGQVEILVERVLSGHEILTQVRASKPLKVSSRLRLEDTFEAVVAERAGEFYRLRLPDDPLLLIERHGHLPLPPYIDRPAGPVDEARYQTVFARCAGSVAAPTAGLHFDDTLLARLKERGIATACVTLHVGAGTFQPVRIQNLAEHRMHKERYFLSEETVAAISACQARGGRVVAVGTTTLRTLEAAALLDKPRGALRAGEGETDLFVTPGFRFRVADLLITNFHLPKSTLLMLVSAFGGLDDMRAAYRHAIKQRYRFFSYGDAMLVHRQGRV